MPVSKGFSESVIDTVLKGKGFTEIRARLAACSEQDRPFPPALPRETVLTGEVREERLKILASQGIHTEYISGRKQLDDLSLLQGNIESYIGMAQVPLGVIGPLRINGVYANGDFYVPLATSEGALVASYNRGAKIITLSGGVRSVCLTERVSRAPGFIFQDISEGGEFIMWVVQHFDELKKIIKKTTAHGQLEDIKVTLEGKYVYLHFEYTTGDAAGQNMVTIATDAACRHIIAESPVKPQHWFIESNMSGDKKATAMSLLFVRGKKVTAEVVIPRKLVSRVLHTTPEKVMEYWKMSFIGSVQSGSIGVQGHYANGLAALFIACGQDAACVAEAAVGITRLDITATGDMYISVSLPNLIVGTVGGGTDLPTQRECLEMIGCKGEGTARKFAEICAATVLAGEISIMGAIAANQFALAHSRYGRKKRLSPDQP